MGCGSHEAVYRRTMGGRIVGWLLVPIGSAVFALAAFMAWSTWDAVSWGFDSASSPAALIAAVGGAASLAGLTLLRGRPLPPVVLVVVVGIAAVVLAADLFARDAGGWILGEADGWQGSDGDLRSSLVPAWALLVEGLALAGLALAIRRWNVQRESAILPSWAPASRRSSADGSSSNP